jgi:hypothetical protein
MKMDFDAVVFMSLRTVEGEGFSLTPEHVSYIMNARQEIERRRNRTKPKWGVVFELSNSVGLMCSKARE